MIADRLEKYRLSVHLHRGACSLLWSLQKTDELSRRSIYAIAVELRKTDAKRRAYLSLECGQAVVVARVDMDIFDTEVFADPSQLSKSEIMVRQPFFGAVQRNEGTRLYPPVALPLIPKARYGEKNAAIFLCYAPDFAHDLPDHCDTRMVDHLHRDHCVKERIFIG